MVLIISGNDSDKGADFLHKGFCEMRDKEKHKIRVLLGITGNFSNYCGILIKPFGVVAIKIGFFTIFKVFRKNSAVFSGIWIFKWI